MAREQDDRLGETSLEPGMGRGNDRPAMGTADLVAAAEGRGAGMNDIQDVEAHAPRQSPVQTDPGREVPQADARTGQARPQGAGREALAALFEPSAASGFRERWREVQVGFVDDPRQAVQHADELVAQVMKSLAESFARQRSRIEAEVGQGDAQASTENLRVALTRYRSFFERLLSL
ncbi:MULTISPECIES: hypothetical protein [Ramlibacter]|uniref:Phasin domain-containing protein n=1 Tax=Ramlibacter aquaticus TaxID=2780094 RepID=A0ABR9SJI9_9BURK|nr:MULTISPECIES: hypothetical protein [Ramlibacter]MBE7942523.1 hypothetical protein [Ramlibacter aquaticus]